MNDLKFCSKRKLLFVYGKWTEFIKCCDYASYEEYIKENSKMKKDSDCRSKSPNDSPSHTPRKVLQKFNSLKVGPFKSNSTQEVSKYVCTVFRTSDLNKMKVLCCSYYFAFQSWWKSFWIKILSFNGYNAI